MSCTAHPEVTERAPCADIPVEAADFSETLCSWHGYLAILGATRFPRPSSVASFVELAS